MCYAPRRMKTRYLVWLLCRPFASPVGRHDEKILGIRDPGEPSVVIKSAGRAGLLIKNTSLREVASEPSTSGSRRTRSRPRSPRCCAPGGDHRAPEIVAKYGTPPGGGKISPRQGTIYQTAEPSSRRPANRGGAALAAAPRSAPVHRAEPSAPRRAQRRPSAACRLCRQCACGDRSHHLDGLRPARAEPAPRPDSIVHPVTASCWRARRGSRDRARDGDPRPFSVAEVQSLAPGARCRCATRPLK